ncbi:transglycosylase SLT domain-containing protein [Streptomyces sp. PLK6-54]|uniref:Transglycosylase SLT domain-containing protein n=2 Tax=Actinacidiphila acidipaludis TaxID=2873382 RepID=A0ABS7Q2J7_9ACTN|nr:transglycosylase SLT domain-containing protein [Streptomyces acidipaludis]
MTKKQKITSAGAAASVAVVLTVTGLTATAGAGTATAADAPTVHKVAQSAPHAPAAKPAAKAQAPAKKAAAKAPAKKAAAAPAQSKGKAASHAATHAPAHHAAAKPAAVKHAAKPAVKHAAAPKAAPKAAPRAAVKHYTNNLDGWIRQSLDILHAKHIPASYEGIHRNVIRESSGNPQAINLWDINARNGIPSKGLLQVIDPTFKRFHVAGTSWNIYNPVANITAACNYAADRYGSMDNVNSAY